MSGRNNKPDNDGKVAEPSRLDQFGDQGSPDSKRKEQRGK